MPSPSTSEELLPPVIFAGLIGICYLISVGANDAANALGTTVGSGALSLQKAMIIGAIFELLGATLVGGRTSSSLGEKFLAIDTFTNIEYAYAMFSALFGGAVWNSVATYFSLPVSSTHAIVGALVFIGVVQNGLNSVNWAEVGVTALSWFLSPLAGYWISFALYFALNRYVMTQPSSFKLAAQISPYLNSVTIATLGLFTFMAGPKFMRIDNAWGLAALFFGLALVSFFVFAKVILPWMETNGYINDGTLDADMENQSVESFDAVKPEPQPILFKHLSSVETDNNNTIVESLVSVTNSSSSPPSSSGKISPAERYFILPMVMTACCVAFAHGSNDVGNSVGPFAKALSIYNTHSMKATETPTMVTFCGGLGIVIGLAAFGKRVIETVGKKITSLTFSKGFAAQYGASLAVLICTAMGLPISTTSVLIGSIAGVGMASGNENSVDLNVIKRIVLGWFATLPAAGAVAAIIFAICKAAL